MKISDCVAVSVVSLGSIELAVSVVSLGSVEVVLSWASGCGSVDKDNGVWRWLCRGVPIIGRSGIGRGVPVIGLSGLCRGIPIIGLSRLYWWF